MRSGRVGELSCGYDCDVSGEGGAHMENIKGNHVALTKEGRTGNTRIRDAKAIWVKNGKRER